MADTPIGADAPVAVIAGSGTLPVEVIEAAQARGLPVFIVAIKGEADEALKAHDPLWLDWGQIGKLISSLKAAGVRDIVLIGGISRRPSFKSIVGDTGTMMRLPRIIRTLARGDDGLLQGVIRLFEAEGFRIIGAHEIAPALLAPPGALGVRTPDESHLRDIALGVRAARRLGALDIGQGAVVVNGRVVAVEAAEGTDGMLRRCAELRAAGRIKWTGRAGVLVKCVKPQQDLRVDLPSIGARTVELAAQAGLAGIAVDAGRVLAAGRAALVSKADAAGLFVTGIAADDFANIGDAADD
ncbi:UDP-2,3-diacylglucosamine diphosphatase LpxI [Breoghania sp. L-A4]|uniref:LpxI family protein n=1 Tax=Breoghania sp. L-A4 TaxID=2304600 RepID=UPI000E35AD3A|nr:UDP-2,3-diacylglucosamine diphosphatase LpxI [Breoghania sp. L-A4]AXS40419.1 DUF1009 domain-containing protein [Breoghania sp. L-A4]